MTTKLYMPARIPTLRQFRDGLSAISDALTTMQRRLLVEQYSFHNHACFAKELAARLDLASWRVVNRHYALAAEKFCSASQFEANRRENGKPNWWTVWSFGFDHGGGRFSWHMHENLVIALEELGWVQLAEAVADFPDELTQTNSYTEGALRQTVVNIFERDRAARSACVAMHGTACTICGFEFSAIYGEIGAGYIHVHHKEPFYENHRERSTDPALDLTPVCPNCHAMLHRRRPALSVEELKTIIASNRT